MKLTWRSAAVPTAIVSLLYLAGCGGGSMGSMGSMSGMQSAATGSITLRINSGVQSRITTNVDHFDIEVVNIDTGAVLFHNPAQPLTDQPITISGLPVGTTVHVLVASINAQGDVVGEASQTAVIQAGTTTVAATVSPLFGPQDLRGSFPLGATFGDSNQIGVATVQGNITFDGVGVVNVSGLNLTGSVNGTFTPGTFPIAAGTYTVDGSGHVQIVIPIPGFALGLATSGLVDFTLVGSLSSSLDKVGFAVAATDGLSSISGVGMIVSNQGATYSNQDVPTTLSGIVLDGIGGGQGIGLNRGSLTTNSNGSITGGSFVFDFTNTASTTGPGTYALSSTGALTTSALTFPNLAGSSVAPTTVTLTAGSESADKDTLFGTGSISAGTAESQFAAFVRPASNLTLADLKGTLFLQVGNSSSPGESDIATLVLDGEGHTAASTATAFSTSTTTQALSAGTYAINNDGSVTFNFVVTQANNNTNNVTLVVFFNTGQAGQGPDFGVGTASDGTNISGLVVER